jgi:putative two-component system response regulator
MCIADVYDALRSQRPYKGAIDHATSVRIITTGDGRTMPGHFDPRVLDAFVAVQSRLRDIYEELADHRSEMQVG